MCLVQYLANDIDMQFSDQFHTGPISIGNRDCEANKISIDFGDLFIKGLQVEENRKVKKQAKVEKRRRTKEVFWQN